MERSTFLSKGLELRNSLYNSLQWVDANDYLDDETDLKVDPVVTIAREKDEAENMPAQTRSQKFCDKNEPAAKSAQRVQPPRAAKAHNVVEKEFPVKKRKKEKVIKKASPKVKEVKKKGKKKKKKAKANEDEKQDNENRVDERERFKPPERALDMKESLNPRDGERDPVNLPNFEVHDAQEIRNIKRADAEFEKLKAGPRKQEITNAMYVLNLKEQIENKRHQRELEEQERERHKRTMESIDERKISANSVIMDLS